MSSSSTSSSTSSSSLAPFLHMSIEVLLLIFGYLDRRDLLSVRLVCSAFRTAVSDPHLWRDRLYSALPIEAPSVSVSVCAQDRNQNDEIEEGKDEEKMKM